MPGEPTALALKEVIEAAGLTDRPYLKEYADKTLDKDTATALLKKLDGAEALIGKKRGIPENDDPKAWDEFLTKLRPEKADDYEYEFGKDADQEFVKTLRAAAHEAGMSKIQLKRQLDKLAPFFAAREKARVDALAARDAEYDKYLKEMSGSADYAKKEERAKAALRELVPETARGFVDKIDDKNLALLVVFADALLSKYAGEDDFTGKNGGTNGSGGGKDKAALTEEMYKVLGSDVYKDFRHADHEKAVARFKELTEAVAKL